MRFTRAQLECYSTAAATVGFIAAVNLLVHAHLRPMAEAGCTNAGGQVCVVRR